MTVFLNLVQESQELLSTLRHTLRGKSKFEEFKQKIDQWDFVLSGKSGPAALYLQVNESQ